MLAYRAMRILLIVSLRAPPAAGQVFAGLLVSRWAVGAFFATIPAAGQALVADHVAPGERRRLGLAWRGRWRWIGRGAGARCRAGPDGGVLCHRSAAVGALTSRPSRLASQDGAPKRQPNRLDDAWGVFALCAPGALGASTPGARRVSLPLCAWLSNRAFVFGAKPRQGAKKIRLLSGFFFCPDRRGASGAPDRSLPEASRPAPPGGGYFKTAMKLSAMRSTLRLFKPATHMRPLLTM